MLLNSFSHIALRIFDSFPIAVATGQGGTIGHVPVVLSFFLYHDLDRIVFHRPPFRGEKCTINPAPAPLQLKDSIPRRHQPGDGEAHPS